MMKKGNGFKKSSRSVRNLFDKVAFSYDLQDSVLSMGRDIAWRKKHIYACSFDLERKNELFPEYLHGAKARRNRAEVFRKTILQIECTGVVLISKKGIFVRVIDLLKGSNKVSEVSFNASPFSSYQKYGVYTYSQRFTAEGQELMSYGR